VFTGAVLANGQVTLSGMTGGAGDVLSIYDGYAWPGAATTGSDGRFTFTAAADPHAVHSYGANATDLAGNVGAHRGALCHRSHAATRDDAGLFERHRASSADRITSDSTLRGTADAGAVVHFAVDGPPRSPPPRRLTPAVPGRSRPAASPMAPIRSSPARPIRPARRARPRFPSHSIRRLPQPVFTGAAQSNGQVTLTGSTGGAGDTVSIYDGTTLLGIANADNGGHFTFSTTASSSTVHSYSANAADLAGHNGYSAGLFKLGSTAGDSLAGSSGGDVLQGGGGADTLTGGARRRPLVYKAAADSTSAAPDTITDFQHGVDMIDFSSIAGLDAANGTVQFQGKLAAKAVSRSTRTVVAFLETGGNTVVLANTTDVAELVKATDTHTADMKLVLLGTHLGLTGSDFDLFGV
jgi:Ca2+-binding RTX toxin-like protein